MRGARDHVQAIARSQGDPSRSEMKMASICSSVPGTQRHPTPSSRIFTTLLRLGVPKGRSLDLCSGSPVPRRTALWGPVSPSHRRSLAARGSNVSRSAITTRGSAPLAPFPALRGHRTGFPRSGRLPLAHHLLTGAHRRCAGTTLVCARSHAGGPRGASAPCPLVTVTETGSHHPFSFLQTH